jgi:hypothetical protein
MQNVVVKFTLYLGAVRFVQRVRTVCMLATHNFFGGVHSSILGSLFLASKKCSFILRIVSVTREVHFVCSGSSPPFV